MLSLILLMQLSAPLPASPTVSPPVGLPTQDALPVAERSRGTAISDPSGSLLGVVDASDASTVTVAVGANKIRLPANALQKTSGRVSASVTRQQVERLMAASAAYQEQANVAPKAVAPPKGFVPLKTASSSEVDGSSLP